MARFDAPGLLRFAIPYAGSAVVLKASTFALSLWMARSVTVDEYGTWGLAFALQTAVVSFGTVGIFESVVALLRRHESPGERQKLFSAATGVLAITIGAAALLSTIVGFAIAGRAALSAVAVVASLASGAILAFAMLQGQLVRIEERHVASLGFQFVVPFVALAGSALFVLARPSAESFFIGSAVGGVLGLLVVRIAGLRAHIGPPDAERRAREIGVRLGPYVATAFFGYISGYGMNLIVASVFPRAEVARLTFAFTIGAVMQLAASALNQVWSPRFFQLTFREPMEDVEAKNRGFFLLQTVILGVIAIAAILLVPPVLTRIGGSLAAYADMRFEIFFILCGYLVLAPWWHAQNYYFAYDRGADLMRVVVLTGIAGTVLWVGAMWALGPIGIYVGFFIQMLLRSVGTAMAARRSWPVKISWTSLAIGPIMAATALVIVRF